MLDPPCCIIHLPPRQLPTFPPLPIPILTSEEQSTVTKASSTSSAKPGMPPPLSLPSTLPMVSLGHSCVLPPLTAIPLRTWFDKATGQVWGMSATLSGAHQEKHPLISLPHLAPPPFSPNPQLVAYAEGRAQFVKISPTTGRCNSTSLPEFEQGNFCAFDPSTNEVWCSVGFSDNNRMQKLQSYNTKTGKISKPILWYTGYYYVMMNLAVSLKF